MIKVLDLELELWKTYNCIAGTDEAGRGSLAGPIVIAAVILPRGFQNIFIQDSKKLNFLQRQKAYQIIKEKALEYKIIFKNVKEIEEKNPLATTKEAMIEAVKLFKNKPDLYLIDGKEKLEIDNIKTLSLIKGDSYSINIAAASILAKVSRDLFMQNIHNQFPIYNWYNNKGYPNKIHLEAIFLHGICNFHRKTYEPIKSLLKINCNLEKIKNKYKKR